MSKLKRLEEAGTYLGKGVPGHRIAPGASLEIGVEVSEETATRLLTTFPDQFVEVKDEPEAEEDEFGEAPVVTPTKPKQPRARK